MKKISSKKGAMEMSVGTIVTIVLLMAVLVLGLTLTRGIFRSAQGAVDLTDQQLKEKISDIFGEDDLQKVAIYPARSIELKKGSDISPLGFSIRNLGTTEKKFKYFLEWADDSCGIKETKSEELIVLRRTGDITIPAGSVMENPILIEFSIPEDTPPCLIDYKLIIKTADDNKNYGEDIGITVEIISK